MVINTNLQAQIGANDLETAQARLAQSLGRLSSGSKLTSPSDDPGGLAVSTQLDAQVQRTDAANSNVSSAISFTQTQDGYLQGISTALDQMSQLAIQAQDGTKTDADRANYNAEYQQLASYVTTASDKDFNGISLFSANALAVTIDSEGGTFSMAGIDLTAAAYTNATSTNISTTTAANLAVASIEAAITQLSTDRASIGSYQARLDDTAQQLTVSKQNLTAASSQIEDVDVADESTNYATQSVLVQSATAMLAQANQLPQSVLKLLS